MQTSIFEQDSALVSIISDCPLCDLARVVATGMVDPADLDADTLASILVVLNNAYRAGAPVVSDHEYDTLFVSELRRHDPSHAFLNAVEPEPETAFGAGRRVVHACPMLSTDKAYTQDEVTAFIQRIEAEAQGASVNLASLVFRATAKLDGIAGMDRDGVLATRGNGFQGNDISRVFERGMVILNDFGRGAGAGELVVRQDYFENHLREQHGMAHPRNFVAGFVGADDLKIHHTDALDAGALVFAPYSALPAWSGSGSDFLARMDEIVEELRSSVPFLTDGVVLEVLNPGVRELMGATSHHHRWMLAIKQAGETAVTTVRGITYQVGRTGRVIPVLELEPVYLSGAEIRRATAHTASHVPTLGLGVGARIEVIRSGEVIPKIVQVLSRASHVASVTHCPSCGHALVADGDTHLACPNSTGCPAQVENTLRHFFSTLGNVDLFGSSTIRRLVEGGLDSLEAIYATDAVGFESVGFGPGQSANLVRELSRSRAEPVEDWRFLAAFGVRHLGRGDARKLLHVHAIESLPSVTEEMIRSIDGFGPITAPAVVAGLREALPTVGHLLDLGFNLTRSAASISVAPSDSPIAGKGVVFTGTMVRGSRGDMEEQARALGANVQSGVTSKTQYLVAGQKVGATKINAAQKHGVTVLSEDEYLALIEVA